MISVRYMTRLGYSLDAMTSFQKKMGVHTELKEKIMGKVKVSHNIMSTHPRITYRIEQAIKLAMTKPVPNPLIKRNAYLGAYRRHDLW